MTPRRRGPHRPRPGIVLAALGVLAASATAIAAAAAAAAITDDPPAAYASIRDAVSAYRTARAADDVETAIAAVGAWRDLTAADKGPEHPDVIRLDVMAEAAKAMRVLDPDRRAEAAEATRIFTGMSLDDRGAYADRLTRYRAAREGWERAFGREHVDTQMALGNEGWMLLEQERSFAAEAALVETLAWHDRHMHPDADPSVQYAHNLALARLKRREYELAERLYLRALEARRRWSPGEEGLAQTCHSYATLLVEVGRADAAVGLAREALRIWSDALEGRSDDAGRRRLANERAKALGNLGEALLATGDPAARVEGRASIAESLARRESLHEPGDDALAWSLGRSARLALDDGDGPAAIALLRRGVAVADAALRPDHPRTSALRVDLGVALLLEGEDDEAVRFFERAAAATERERGLVPGGLVGRTQFESRASAEAVAAGLAFARIRAGDAAGAAMAIEVAGGRALLDALAGPAARAAGDGPPGDDRSLAGAHDDLAAARAAFDAARRALTQAELDGEDVETAAATLGARRGAVTEALAAVRTLAGRHAPVAPAPAVDPAGDLLGPGDRIVRWAWSHDVAVVVLSRREASGGLVHEGRIVAANPGEVAALARSIAGARRVIVSGQRLFGGRSAASMTRLRERLLPAGAADASRHGTTWLVPSGPLLGLPPDALLPVARRLVVTPSAAVSVALAERRRGPATPGERLVALAAPGGSPAGDPVWLASAESGDGVSVAGGAGDVVLRSIRLARSTRVADQLAARRRQDPLVHAAAEGRRIAELVAVADGTAVLLTGDEATATALRNALAGADVVHLATHGFTGTRRAPVDAGLLVAPGDGTGLLPGYLTLRDLLEDWGPALASCDLAVLSACESGSAAAEGGRLALPWGFLGAGVPSVVCSLWRVPDDATRLLMERFHAERLGLTGNGPPMVVADALAAAKRWLRDLDGDAATALLEGRADVATTVAEPGGDDPFRTPLHWAGFVVVGRP